MLDGSIDYAQKNDVMIVAWRPTQKGLFPKEPAAVIKKMCGINYKFR